MKITKCIKLLRDENAWQKWISDLYLHVNDVMPPECYPCYGIQQANGFNYFDALDLNSMIGHLLNEGDDHE